MLLNETFEYMVKSHDIHLDLIIYLRCPPDRCYNRMLNRSRPEETSSLTLVSRRRRSSLSFAINFEKNFQISSPFQDHFKRFHDLHETFLSEQGLFRTKYNIPVLIIESLDTLDDMQKACVDHSKIIMDRDRKSVV